MRALPKIVALALLAGASASPASAFSASFQWCSKTPRSTTSPAFSLTDAPKGTTSLSLQMMDRQAPSYPHGGGTVAYKGGGKIACGAIASGWIGPFPPDGEVHTYEFTLEAFDKDRKPLATAHATRKFPQ